MSAAPYMTEPWFALLSSACGRMQRSKVAALLGVSAPTISQVLNGSGLYGTGKASTARLAAKVAAQFDRMECPYLTQQNEAQRLITIDECRVYAHRPPPIGSPGAIKHWQACRNCPQFKLTAPPQQRPVVPRKKKAPPPTHPSEESMS